MGKRERNLDMAFDFICSKFAVLLFLCQATFIILFGCFVDYGWDGTPVSLRRRYLPDNLTPAIGGTSNGFIGETPSRNEEAANLLPEFSIENYYGSELAMLVTSPYLSLDAKILIQH